MNQNQNEYLYLFYHCLYELYYSINDLSLREYAFQCLELFLKKNSFYQTYAFINILKEWSLTLSDSLTMILLLDNLFF